MSSYGKTWRVESRQQCRDEIDSVARLILNHTQKEVAEITGLGMSKVKNIIYRHTMGATELRRRAKLKAIKND